MEKLIELLNEYNCDVLWLADHREYKDYMWWMRLTSVWAWKIYLYVISKEYWFIKWLVENDKIDKKKIDTRLVRNVESHYDEDWYWVENSYEDYSDTDTLLMLLSISDTPIEDLISYLK